MRTWDRLQALFRREQLDRELDDEIRSHIELATEDYVRRGFPAAEARRQARLKFGAIEASKDAHRDSRGIASLDALFYDLRFAIKSLKHDRSFTAAAVIVIARHAGHIHARSVDLRPGDTSLFVHGEVLDALKQIVQERAVVRAIEAAR